MIKDLLITPLDIIETPGGNVMHAMKNDSPGYFGFGEAYFSEIEYKMIKAWKRHREMTLNLVVPHGEVRFILYDDRHVERIKFQEIIISKNNYDSLNQELQTVLLWWLNLGCRRNTYESIRQEDIKVFLN